MLWLLPTALSAAIPSVVATSSSQLTTNQASAGATWVPGKVAVDTNGNLFIADIGIGAVWEVPASGATPFVVAKGYGGINGVALDSANNLYVNNTYSGGVLRLPLQNGVYSTVSPTNLTANLGSLDGYYMQPSDLTVDSAGNAYFACGAAGCGGAHSLFKVKTDGTNPVILIKTLTTAPTGIAVDKVGNLYYADGTNVYTIPTSSTGGTPTVIGKGFKTPKGVAVDASNNLYVTDSTGNLVYVIPFGLTTAYPAGGPDTSNQYLLSTGLSANGSPGVDALGNLYASDGYASRSVYKMTVGGAVLPAAAIGATTAANVTYTFNVATSPASIAYLQGPTATGSQFTQNGTTPVCLTNPTLAAGTSCTVRVNFKPTAAGLQTGAAVLRDTNGAALATAYLSGTGNAAALTFDPSAQTSLTVATSAAIGAPSAVAFDAAGNAYAADTANNQIVIFPAGGGQGTAIAGTSLVKPLGVAVDGAGNLVISDSGNNRLVGIPNVGGTLTGTRQVTLATGLKSPQGIAIGPDGAIYVADTGNTRVLRFATWQGWGSLLQTTVGTGYQSPVALAVDAGSNVTVVDNAANLLSRVNQFGGSQATSLAGLNAPTGVGLDAAGNAYVLNSGSRSVSRYLNNAGLLDPNSGVPVGTGLLLPTALAVNAAGNAVVADNGGTTAAIYSLVRTAGAVNLGKVNSGDSGAANLATLTNSGNLPLTLGSPAYTEAGASTSFQIAPAASNGCAAAASLAPGTSCGYTASLVPVAFGNLTDTLTFSSNSVSVASPTLTLTGIGTNLIPTGTTVTQTVPAAGVNGIYGQSVTVSATVVTKRSGGPDPTGTVTFNVDGSPRTPVPLSTVSPFTASLVLTGLNGGAHVVSASYSGDTFNASSNGASIAVTVSKANAGIALAATPSIPVAPGVRVLFGVVATSATTGIPTGTVNLLIAGKVIATGSLAVGKIIVDPNNPILSISTLPLGVYQVTAQYLGDVNFNASTSPAITVIVRNPDYDLIVPNTTVTVTAGSPGTLPLAIQPISGFGGAQPTLFNAIVIPGYSAPTSGSVVVTPPCTGLPAFATCSFNPGYVNFNSLNPAAMVLQVNTNVATNTTLPYPSGMPFLPGLLGGLGILLAVLAAPKQWSRRSMRLTALAVTIASGLIAMNGCGSGIRLQATNNITPAGTYPLTLTFSGVQNGGTATFTANTTTGSNVLTTVSSFASLSVGIPVNNGTTGAGQIPLGTYVTALDPIGKTVTLSNPVAAATNCGTGQTPPGGTTCIAIGATITITPPPIVHTVNVTLVVQ